VQKKMPGIMKSGLPYLQRVSDYIDTVAKAERHGRHRA
jgi:hypothetical protein